MCLSETSRYTKGGESLGDEESSKEEEEVVPALILASGVRPLAPDVKSYFSDPTSHTYLTLSPELKNHAEISLQVEKGSSSHAIVLTRSETTHCSRVSTLATEAG